MITLGRCLAPLALELEPPTQLVVRTLGQWVTGDQKWIRRTPTVLEHDGWAELDFAELPAGWTDHGNSGGRLKTIVRRLPELTTLADVKRHFLSALLPNRSPEEVERIFYADPYPFGQLVTVDLADIGHVPTNNFAYVLPNGGAAAVSIGPIHYLDFHWEQLVLRAP